MEVVVNDGAGIQSSAVDTGSAYQLQRVCVEDTGGSRSVDDDGSFDHVSRKEDLIAIKNNNGRSSARSRTLAGGGPRQAIHVSFQLCLVSLRRYLRVRGGLGGAIGIRMMPNFGGYCWWYIVQVGEHAQ